MTFDKEGCVYVVDYHCIKEFTPTGKYGFGYERSNPGQLKYPSSIIVDNNLVYVNELSNHCVSIFDTNGCYLHCFGKQGGEEGELNGPFELECDGCMYQQ